MIILMLITQITNFVHDLIMLGIQMGISNQFDYMWTRVQKPLLR